MKARLIQALIQALIAFVSGMGGGYLVAPSSHAPVPQVHIGH